MRAGRGIAGALGRTAAGAPPWARSAVAFCFAAAAGLALLRATAPPLLDGASFSRAVYDRDGRLLRLTLSGDEKYRLFTPLETISPLAREAFVLREDRGFWTHAGVSPAALARAAWSTLGGRLREGGGARAIGGSTITMQLARIQRGLRTRGPVGKLRQIAAALWIEARHSKKEILEAYLNLAPFGGNVEGVGAASLVAYRKRASELTLPEALTLALIPQSPSSRGFPSQARPSAGVDRLLEARGRLFEDWIRRRPEDAARRADMALPLASERASSLPFLAPHFVDEALRRAPRAGESDGELRTTLDLGLQKLLEGKIAAYVAGQAANGVKNAAALLIDHSTMEALAWVGSADWNSAAIHGQVNGVLAKRSPGSSIKPFLYALAFDQGLIHPETRLKDTRMSFGSFDPENFDREFSGPVSAREALIRSRNVPAVYLSSLLQGPTLYEFLKQAGIARLREPERYGLSIALGGAETTMEEMIRLYAALAHAGAVRSLRVFDGEPVAETSRLFSPEAAFLTLDVLQDNPRPDQSFSSEWTRGPAPVAWKTGTSHGFRDAWAIGLVGRFGLAVWLGNFDNEPNQAFIGRELAGPLFFSIVDGLKARAGDRLARPAWLDPAGLNVKKVKACALSGLMPGPKCGREIETWFIPGKSPIKPCDVHREIWLSRANGLRACRPSPPSAVPSVFEFWPTDLLDSFRKAGMPRRPPPAFEPGCRSDELAAQGAAPQIASPKLGVAYAHRALAEEGNVIPFYAVADGDARRLSWFVGDELVAQAPAASTVFWKSRPGRFRVRVVDDLGRADARDLDVRVSR